MLVTPIKPVHMIQPIGKDLPEIDTCLQSCEIERVIENEALSLDKFAIAVDKAWSGRSKGKCVIKVDEYSGC